MESQRFVKLFFFSFILFEFYEQLTGVVSYFHAASRIVHGVDVFEGNNIIELIDLFLNFPIGAFFYFELFAD